MATQLLGGLVAVAGIALFFITAGRAGQQPMLPLTGVVTFIGGLNLWAVGRVERALRPLAANAKGGGFLSLLLLFLIVVVGIAAVFLVLFAESAPS